MSYRFILYKVNNAPLKGPQQIVYVKQVNGTKLVFSGSPDAAQRMNWCAAYFYSLFKGCLHVQMVKQTICNHKVASQPEGF